jgi:nucleoside-diphosphate-sugar epimerase
MLGGHGATVASKDTCRTWFHLAAQTDADKADGDPAADWRANVEPLYELIQDARRLPRPPFIVFAGSATQVGAASGTIDGTERDEPLTVYDLHKLAAEQALEHARRRGWVRGATLRLANVFGWSPAESGPSRGIVNRWVRTALRGGSLDVYGTGEWLRDYVHVDDVCRAFMLTAANQEQTNGHHYVVGSGRGAQLADVAAEVQMLAQSHGAQAKVRHVDGAGLDALATRSAVMNPGPLREATGWEAQVSLSDGINEAMAVYQAVEP